MYFNHDSACSSRGFMRQGHERTQRDWVAYALLVILATFIFNKWIGLWAIVPSHHEWLYQGDYRQNFAAINLFRASPWHFPLGDISTSDFPVGSNIVFMDGNLLLAIVTKLLNPFLDPVAQTYGAWIWLCMLLQLWAIYWALRQMAVPSVFAFAGTFLTGLVPTFYYRILHLNLLPHFLIIYGWGTIFSIFLSDTFRRRIFSVLVVFSVFTHFYFTPPLLIMAVLAQWRTRSFCTDSDTRRFVFRQTLFFLFLALAAMFVAGYFEKFRINAGGFGTFSMNLNALINPMGTSKYLPSLPTGTDGQYEGYQYPGLGLLLFLLISWLVLGRKMLAGVGWPVFCLWMAMFLFSLSNQIYFGSWLVLGVKLPRWLLGAVAPFRSSGRYMWFVIYPALIIVFANLYQHLHNRFFKRNIVYAPVFVLSIVLLGILQYQDIHSLVAAKHFSAPPQTLPAETEVAKSLAGYISGNGFKGPVFIDESDENVAKNLIAPLTTALSGRIVSISPAPNVRENKRYQNRNHIKETMDANGLVATRSCGREIANKKINLPHGWCIYFHDRGHGQVSE